LGKILVVAEKPKVANEILKLPRFRGSARKQGSKPYYGYYENERYIVTWCRGHLLQVMNPEEHDEKYKQFRFEDLPIFLPTKYKPTKDAKEQLDFVVQLMQRADVDHILNCCDNDKEGELIFREIYEYANVDKKVSRIFKSSHEKDELEAAFNSLLPGSQFDSLAAAAKARQYMDHLLGTTITRASTTKLADNRILLASGRIQMCLLAEIHKRQMEVQNFKEETFYTLSISTENGIDAQFKTEIMFKSRDPLKSMGDSLKDQPVTILDYEDKESKSQPKNLYNLTDIYRESIKRFKANTAVVQKHIQHLYDSGYITYPRTDSRHLPVARLEKVLEAFQQLENNDEYKELAQMVEPGVISAKHSAFNDKKVTAHYAIVPTNKKYDKEGRPELEQQLYDMIVRRFIGRFMPAARYQVRRITLVDSEGREFQASQKILISPGYLTVFKEDIEEGVEQSFSLPEVEVNQTFLVRDYLIKEGKTRRPSLHNEASVLSFMENAGNYIEDDDTSRLLKGKRIGTTATEHSFLPKLVERKFIESDSKGHFTTTEIGKLFIDSFPVDDLKNPEFTAELEGSIELIIDGELSLDVFMEETKELANKVVREMANLPGDVSKNILNTYKEQTEVCACLCKEGKLVNRGTFYGCSRYPDCNVTFPMKIKGKTIPVNQVKKLFEEGSSDLIKGFKNEDKTFDAFLFVEDQQIKFRFPTVEEKSVGQCPKCENGHVVMIQTKESKKFYSCSNYKAGCKFQLPHKLMGVSLPVTQIRKYLKDGHTDFINGFQKEDKEFTAALVMNEEKEISFKFPTKEDRTLGKCRLCGNSVLVGKRYYLCENYKKGCDFILPGTFLEKQITTVQAKKLLTENLTDVIKGFKKKDGSGTFDARLSYSEEEKRITFIFPKKQVNKR
jgi:DNA topoisomerase-1/DNA topoisomerase-3